MLFATILVRRAHVALAVLLSGGIAFAQAPATPVPATPLPATPPTVTTPVPAAPQPTTPTPPVTAAPTPQPGTPPAQTPPATAAPTSPPVATPPVVTLPQTTDDVVAMEIKPRPAVVLAGSATWEVGFKNINDALDKVRAAATKAGLTATGHAVAAFVDTDDNGFKFEAMLPIEKAPDGKTDLGDGVKIGATPGGKALKFQHRGAYEDIDTTYEAITAYLDEKNFEAQNVFVEEYLNMPKSPDDTSAEVDIYVLIK